jgi:hypothetical protein
MKRFFTFKPLLLLTLGLAPVAAQAQVPGFLKRIQVGYTIPMEKANYIRTYPVPNPASLKIDDSFRDTTVTSVIEPSAAVGGLLGTYFRVAKLGKASTLNISVEANLNMLTWDNAESQSQTPDQKQTEVITGTTTAIGLPVGVDLKFGADAYPDKSYRWTSTFGVGANAGSIQTTLNNASNSEIAVRPYIRGEVGLLAGMCFKVRATYTFGQLQYIRTDNSAKNSQGNIYANITTLTNKSSFAVSLIVMPFAPMWDKSRWWK